MAVALRRKGYDVTVACSVSGTLARPLKEVGVTVRPLIGGMIKRRVDPAYVRRLRRLVKVGSFDLVHAHVYASAVATALATLGTGASLVVTEALWQGRGARSVSWFVYWRARHVIAV